MEYIYYYIVNPKTNVVLAKHNLLTWAKTKQADLYLHGVATRLYKVTHSATGTKAEIIK